MASDSTERCDFEIEELMLRKQVTLSGEIEAIGPVVDEIMDVVDESGCAGEDRFEVEVSLCEALANAVKHGCSEDPAKKVQVCVACDVARGMLIIVRDPGPGFDPGAIPSPVQGENLFLSHGRGIFLINQLMDEVHFKEGGTEIWMHKRVR